MSIKASEISELIKARIQNFTAATEARSVGTVVTVTDGICRIHGPQDVVQQRRMIDEGETHEDFKRIQRSKLDALLALAEKGCADLTRLQAEALADG